ncbi:lipase family protein [Parendozoicomonas haliclonae]|uniref:Lipase (Class 3) n=1 Tax=Parendozoicomonas haliclonae TaxID=1960125 RepID=A0A1X7AQY0_9GAMM|nr:lipase family protein [Parendozoicomonas haliclonae]SMA50645.1 Lipase (class 3) [Parendozoicomonas haliclonae]
MSTLPARAASQMASDVYLVKSENLDPSTNMDLELALDRNKQYFDLGIENKLEGKSGGLIINKTSGFGIVSKGKGAYSKDAFIILRGTATGYDVLTDLNAGFSSSTSNHAVHLGFNNTFKTLKPQLETFFAQQRETISTIHCIGHSLGGALATLAAEWAMQTKKAAQVNLYTFGCPRVGILSYTDYFENHTTCGGIYRAYHKTDPIPMVPIWPFVHLLEQDSYGLPSPGHYINPEYHRMVQYINTIGSNDWGTLDSLYKDKVEDSAIEKWLASDSFVSLTANTIRLFSSAIGYVIRKVLKAIGITIQTVLGAATTLLDQLAYTLHRGLKAAEATSNWVMRLIKKMAKALGIVIQKGKSLTMQFIRYVLQAMSNHIRTLVQKAVDFVMQRVY